MWKRRGITGLASALSFLISLLPLMFLAIAAQASAAISPAPDDAKVVGASFVLGGTASRGLLVSVTATHATATAWLWQEAYQGKKFTDDCPCDCLKPSRATSLSLEPSLDRSATKTPGLTGIDGPR